MNLGEGALSNVFQLLSLTASLRPWKLPKLKKFILISSTAISGMCVDILRKNKCTLIRPISYLMHLTQGLNSIFELYSGSWGDLGSLFSKKGHCDFYGEIILDFFVIFFRLPRTADGYWQRPNLLRNKGWYFLLIYLTQEQFIYND